MAERLNVLLVVVDEERRWTDLPEGFDWEKELPNRARFRAGAIEFPNFRISCSPCEPARACLYAGSHMQTHGCFCNKNDFPTTTKTIGNMMRDSGYHCVFKGKWHLTEALTARLDTLWPESARKILETYGITDKAETQEEIRAAGKKLVEKFPRWNSLAEFGFEEWNNEGDFWGAPQEGFEHDAITAQEAVDWLKQRKAKDEKQPWFLTVNLINPHDIMFFNATQHQADTREWPLPEGRPLLGPPDHPIYNKKWGLKPRYPERVDHPFIVERQQAQFSKLFGEMGDEERQLACDYYVNCLRDSDRHLGTILDAVDETGFSANTAVIFVSDHGEMLGDHGLRMKGPYLYKGHLSVPFLLRVPGAQPEVSNRAVCSVDLAPTILSLAGVKDWAVKFPNLAGSDATESSDSCPEKPDNRKHTDPDLDGATMFQFAKPGARKKGEGKGKKGKGKDKGKGHFNQGAATSEEETIDAGGKGKADKNDNAGGKGKGDDAGLPSGMPKGGKAQGKANHEARMCMQALITNRYKYARCFNIHEFRCDRWENFPELMEECDLILMDVQADPHEMTNLAADAKSAESHQALIEKLNHHLNKLIADEATIGTARLAPWQVAYVEDHEKSETARSDILESHSAAQKTTTGCAPSGCWPICQ